MGRIAILLGMALAQDSITTVFKQEDGVLQPPDWNLAKCKFFLTFTDRSRILLIEAFQTFIKSRIKFFLLMSKKFNCANSCVLKKGKFLKVCQVLCNPSTLLKVLDQTSRLLLIGLVFFRIFRLFDILVRYKVLFKGVDLIWVFTWRNYRVLLQPSKTKFSAQSLTAIILLSSYQVFLKIISFGIVFQP